MVDTGPTLAEKLKSIRSKIDSALQKSKWGPRNVTLLGATKGQGLTSIRSAAELGVLDMGENYAQELLTKAPMCLDTDIRWHFIGKLQANKIKHILPYVASIQSVDSLELAERIVRVAQELETPRTKVPILLQVNLGNERQKAGLPPQVIESLFEQFLKIEGIIVAGLMSVPPVTKDNDRARSQFKVLKELFDKLKAKHSRPEIFNALSMGMSADFEIAVEEGSTCIRIGEALFGPRPKKEEE
jgi:pyridoxal phosphate enzyme (YggS family)